MHDGLMGGRALALSWDGRGRRWLVVAALLLAALLLMTALMVGPMGTPTDDLAAGESEMVVAGGSWSFSLPDPGTWGRGGAGPSWG